MTWIKAVLKWFVIIFAVLAFTSYLIVTFGPLIGICFGIIYAACQSGSTWYLFVAVWVLPGLIAIVTSPFMVDYVKLCEERNARREAEEARLDAEDEMKEMR